MVAIVGIIKTLTKAGKALAYIDRNKFHEHNISVTLQVLDMKRADKTWIANGSFVLIHPPNSDENNFLEVVAQGKLCCPLYAVANKDGNFVFDMDELQDLASMLFEPMRVSVTNLPVIPAAVGIPYLDNNGDGWFLQPALETASGVDVLKCIRCPSNIPRAQMRRHVGSHILNGHLSHLDSCGWCGVSLQTNSDHYTTLAAGTKNSVVKMVSNCPYFYKELKFAVGIKPTVTSPCLNLPFPCPNCLEEGEDNFIWRYNLENHYILAHRDVELPLELVVKGYKLPARVSDEESQKVQQA